MNYYVTGSLFAGSEAVSLPGSGNSAVCWYTHDVYTTPPEITALESLRANDGSGNELRPMNFDPLEVLSYLERGFITSPLDRWFTGDSPPSLAPSDVIIRPFNSVRSALETTRSFLGKKLPEERRNASFDDRNKTDMVEDDRRGSRSSEMSVVSFLHCMKEVSRLIKA
jgi:hypothetical protein